jgi:hypothetical protein
MLKDLRNVIAQRDYPNGYIITGKILMSDLVVDTLAARVRDITSVDAITQTVRWNWAPQYGAEVFTAIQSLLIRHPDLELQAREEGQRERAFAALNALAESDRHKKLLLIFDACHEAILRETRPGPKTGQTVKRCQRFLALPRKTVSGIVISFPFLFSPQAWPVYYEIIKEPISIAQIKKYSHNKQLVTSTTEYAALWHRLFSNARQFNIEGSPIYEDAEFLQEVFDRTLEGLEAQYRISHGIPQLCKCTCMMPKYYSNFIYCSDTICHIRY